MSICAEYGCFCVDFCVKSLRTDTKEGVADPKFFHLLKYVKLQIMTKMKSKVL